MALENLLYEVSDGIAKVTVNRPKALNALNPRTMAELREVFTEVRDDTTVGVAILTGAGDKAFVAGSDIKNLSGLDSAAAEAESADGQATFDHIDTLGKPVIGAINGFALGGGAELALACTFRIASENAKVGFPEVTLGVIPGYAGTQRLPRLVGKGIALEMILSGRFLDAEAARRVGIFNRVVPQAELMATCEKVAQKILSVGPLAVRAAINVVNRGLETTLESGQLLERKAFGDLFGTKDGKEGLNAFIEKRKPDFTGQ